VAATSGHSVRRTNFFLGTIEGGFGRDAVDTLAVANFDVFLRGRPLRSQHLMLSEQVRIVSIRQIRCAVEKKMKNFCRRDMVRGNREVSNQFNHRAAQRTQEIYRTKHDRREAVKGCCVLCVPCGLPSQRTKAKSVMEIERKIKKWRLPLKSQFPESITSRALL
jgi:hypothetical protein